MERPQRSHENKKRARGSIQKQMGKALKARNSLEVSVDPDAILNFVHMPDFDFVKPHRTISEIRRSQSGDRKRPQGNLLA